MMRTKPTMIPSTPRPKATPHSTFSRRSEGSAFWGTGKSGRRSAWRPGGSREWWVSRMTREKLRHGKLRWAQREKLRHGKLRWAQREKQGPSGKRSPPVGLFCRAPPQETNFPGKKGLTPVRDCYVAVELMSHDAGEKVRGCRCEV